MIRLSLILLLLIVSCKEPRSVLGDLDLWGFSILGRPLLSEADFVRIKEVHLNNSALLGRSVVVAGDLQKIGDHRTYLVISDSSARLVVKLTELSSTTLDKLKGDNNSKRQRLKIIGRVALSRKGQPHISAQAIKVLAHERG